MWGADTSSECKYAAALLLALKQALKRNNTGDATDRNADQFLSLWQKRENRRKLLTEQLSRRKQSCGIATKTGKEEWATLPFLLNLVLEDCL